MKLLKFRNIWAKDSDVYEEIDKLLCRVANKEITEKEAFKMWNGKFPKWENDNGKY